MIRVFFAILLLLPLRLSAATGDILAVEILPDGWTADITIEGKTAGGTYAMGWGANNATGANKITFHVVSKSLSDTYTETTIDRTVYGSKRVRKPWPNDAQAEETASEGNVKVRVALTDYIWAKDEAGSGNSGTNVTVDIASGFYTQSGGNNAAADFPVTNNSTAPYQPPVANWAMPGYQRVTGSFVLRVVGGQHDAQQGRPLRGVKFSVTDGVNPPQEVIATALTKEDTLPDMVPVLEYQGAFDAKDFTQGAELTANFIAWGWIGDTDSDLDTSTGTVQPTPLAGPIKLLCDKTGAYGVTKALVDPVSGGDAAGVAYSSAAFDESTAAPFLTISGAAEAIANYNSAHYSRNDVGAGEILLKAGSYSWLGATDSYGTKPKTWLTITHSASTTRDNVVITGKFGATNISDLVRLYKVKLTNSTNNLFSGIDSLWFDTCYLNTSGTAIIPAGTVWYVTHCALQNMQLEPFTGNCSLSIMRGNEYLSPMSRTARPHVYIGNLRAGSNWVSDSVFGMRKPSNTAPIAKIIVGFNKIYGFSANGSSSVFGLVNEDQCDGLILMQNVFEKVDDFPESLSNFNTSEGATTNTPIDNCLIWHNTFVGGRTGYGYNSVGTILKHRRYWSMKNNYHDITACKSDTFPTENSARVGNWPLLWSVGQSGNIHGNNQDVGSSGFDLEFAGRSSIETGRQEDSTFAKFVNRAAWYGVDNVDGLGNGDYHGATGSPLLNLPIDYILPYDIDGDARITGEDASGAFSKRGTLPSNDAPVAVADSAASEEDTPTAITLRGSDADGDLLTFDVASPPSHGTLSGTAPDLLYTPDADWNGADSFHFTVTDGLAVSAAAEFTISVAPVNDTPVAASQTVHLAEDTPADVRLEATDADGDALTWLITVTPAHGTLSGNLPLVTYAPHENWYGTDSFAFTASEAAATSAPAVVSIEVAPVNDAPVAVGQSVSTRSDTPLPVTVAAVDVDGDALSYTLVTAPANGTLSGTLPGVLYSPNPGWSGADSFTFSANDGTAASAPAVVSIAVTAVNEAPAALSQSVSGAEDTLLALTLTGTDADGDALSFAIVEPPSHGVLSGALPALTYTPDPHWNGVDTFSFTVNDGTATSDPAGIAITVTPVNDAPAAGAQSLSTAEDTGVALTLTGTDAEGDALTFAVTAPPAHGTLSGTAPDLMYAPDPDWNGADGFTFTVSDGTEVSAPALVAITVIPVNDLPVAAARSFTTAEDQSFVITLMGADADGDLLTFDVASPPSHGTLSGTAPDLIYTPEPHSSGPDSFTFTVSDGTGTSAPALVSIAVTPVNDAPVAVADSAASEEDTPTAITLRGSDADGDLLTFDVASPPSHGTLSGTAPDLLYTPDADWNGADSFHFTVTDGLAVSADAEFTISVAPVNDTPVAASQTVHLAEDTPADVRLEATDADGDALTWLITVAPAHGTLSGNLPLVTYAPHENWYGTDSFAFTASEAAATSAPAVVSIEVAPVNDAPVAVGQSVSTRSDTPLPVTVAAVDVDGDALSYTLVTAPANGTLSGTLPGVLYSPNPGWSGADSFTFSANDGTAASAPAVVSIAVTAVNEAPAALSQSVSGAEDTLLALTLTGTDADGDALSFAIVEPPSHGVLSGALPALTYTPDPHWNGVDTFSFTVNDGTATSDPAGIAITVTPVNDAPAAGAQSLSTAEDTGVALTLTGTDAEGDALTFAVTAPPAHGTLSGTAPDLMYAPDPDWNGADGFTFTVSDGTEVSAPALVAITVIPVNDLPVAAARSFTTAEDQSFVITLMGADADGDLLTFDVASPPSHGTLSGTAPDLIYTPEPHSSGPDSFTFTVSDGTGTSAPALVSIAVTPVNDAPVAVADSAASEEDTPTAITLRGSDADGDLLTFDVASPPSHGTLSGTAPDLLYTPDADWNGADSFHFTVTDGLAVSAAAEFTISVAPVNDTPVAASQTVHLAEDTPADVRLEATDADGDALTWLITVAPAHGTLSGNLPLVTYAPHENWYGTDSFAFTASEAAATSAPAVVSIEVAPVNDAPVAVGQSVSTRSDTPLPVTVAAVDVDGDALSYTLVTAPANGTLSGTLPGVLYSPNPGWSGADSFTFSANDGTAASAPAVVSIAVTAVNEAPAALSQSVSGAEDTLLALTLTGTDADGDALSFAIVEPPSHGVLSGALPALTYTPDPHWNGVDTFSFTVNDGTATSDPAGIAITVTPVNDAPAAGAQSLSTAEDTGVALTLTGTDAEGEALTFAVTAPPAHGTLSGTAPDLMYAPDPDWNGADGFTFTVSDGTEVSAPALVAITVIPVNDLPVAAARSFTTAEDQSFVITLMGADADGDLLTFDVASPPSHGTLSGTAPDLIYTPEPHSSGLDSFTFTVSDGTGTSAPALVSIAVTPVNDAPVAVADSAATEEDTPTAITLRGSDADGDLLTFDVASPPSHGTLSGTAPDLLYTPDADWNGADSFHFTVTDGLAVSADAEFTISVAPVNDAPVATAVNGSTAVGFPVSLTLSGSDADADSLTWAVIVPPAFGTLSGDGATITYTPNLAWSGTDEFWFTVSDGSATSPSAAATVTVANSGPWQLVARTGVTAPGTGGATFALFASDFVSDSAGRASFRGTAGSITGIWTEGTAGLEAIAVQGAAAPGVAGAVFDAVSAGPWAAGDGEALVFGKLLAGTSGVTTSNDLGYWLRSSAAPMSLVARENNPVPGLPAGARFNVLSAVATLEAGGNYAFAASIRTNSSLGITFDNDTGLWATFGAPLQLMVRENSAAPGASGGLFDTLTSASLVSNVAGQLAFATSLKVEGSITTANRYGLWLWDPAQFGLVARGGNAAPGTPAGALFAEPQQPALGGSLAFRATLNTKSVGVTPSTNTGIWALDDGSITLLAREGFQAPGIPVGGLFDNLADGPTVNAAGELAFRANLRNAGGVTSANNAGLWVRSRFTGNALTIVARKGAVAPGTGSATFASFDVPFLASDGGEVFTATLTSGTGGVTTSNDRGLWLRTAASSLALALREGAAFTLAPGDSRTIAGITLPAAGNSGRTPLSDEGRLLILFSFTDGSSALYHYVLP